MTPLFWQHILSIDPSGTRFRELIEALGTSYLDPIATLLSDKTLSDSDRKKIARIDPRKVAAVMESGVEILEREELGENYQQAIGTAPVLFCSGEKRPFDMPMVAIVGTRKATAYGRAAASKFAEVLARSGVCVVSGGAFGIDSAAHEGALIGGGPTVAVLGTGIDIVYPAANASLFQQIKQNGCLVSQFAIGTPSLQQHFLFRNYTVAAIADCILVVEAPEKSGALTTARHAAELGKEVFVVPGPITLESFRGSHGLIRDGAQLVDHPRQILESLGLRELTGFEPQTLGGIQDDILEVLSEEPLSSEKIAEVLGLEPAEVMNELTMLELDGHIVRAPAGYARKPR